MYSLLICNRSIKQVQRARTLCACDTRNLCTILLFSSLQRNHANYAKKFVEKSKQPIHQPSSLYFIVKYENARFSLPYKYSLKLRTWHLNPRLFRFRIFFIVITIMQIAANIMTINPSKLPSKPIEAKWSPKASIERRRSYTVKNKSVLVIFWFLFSGGNTWIGY